MKCPARINGRSCRRVATTSIESTLASTGLCWSLKQEGLLCERCAGNFESIRAHVERLLVAHHKPKSSALPALVYVAKPKRTELSVRKELAGKRDQKLIGRKK